MAGRRGATSLEHAIRTACQSPGAAKVTGQVISVRGGISASRRDLTFW
jgi:hypothetical protein